MKVIQTTNGGYRCPHCSHSGEEFTDIAYPDFEDDRPDNTWFCDICDEELENDR